MNHPVLFFDGICNLCNASVQFIIRHDRKGVIRFAALQSAAGKAATTAVAQQYGRVPDSLIFLDGKRYYIESDAALRTARYLDGGWRLLGLFRFLPHFLRNAGYRLVARNRYRWFGKRHACMIPTPELNRRFLEGDF